MRSLVAAIVAVSVCSLQAHALAFHVHAISGHTEDASHQHGPAIHHHDDFDSARHVDEEERPDAGPVITIGIAATIAAAVSGAVGVVAEALPTPELQLIGDARAIDVRSHGPPHSRNSSLRGPPALSHS